MGKIINLFKNKKEEKKESQEEEYDFSTVIEKNKRNQEKIKKDRSQKNRSTLRSYFIKH